MKYLLILISLLLFLFSCTSSKKIIPQDDLNVKETSGYDERFDPLSLDDDDIVIQASQKQEDIPQPQTNDHKKKENDQNLESEQEVDGYRIQIYASRSIEGATVAQQKAKDEFGPMNHKVYMIFETPFYKIRIGDFVDRIPAEDILETVKSMDYDQSFLVFGKIILRKPAANNLNE